MIILKLEIIHNMKKDDTSHTKQDDLIVKVKDTKNTNDDDEYKEDS